MLKLRYEAAVDGVKAEPDSQLRQQRAAHEEAIADISSRHATEVQQLVDQYSAAQAETQHATCETASASGTAGNEHVLSSQPPASCEEKSAFPRNDECVQEQAEAVTSEALDRHEPSQAKQHQDSYSAEVAFRCAWCHSFA